MTIITIKTLCILISNILSFFLAVSITSFCLDKYQLSEYKYIKIIQRLTPLIIILIVILNMYIEIILEHKHII